MIVYRLKAAPRVSDGAGSESERCRVGTSIAYVEPQGALTVV